MKIAGGDPLAFYARPIAADDGRLIERVVEGDDVAGELLVQRVDESGGIYSEPDPDRPGKTRVAVETIRRPFRFELDAEAPEAARALFDRLREQDEQTSKPAREG